MATHSSILAWRIPWTEEPGKSMGSQELDMTQQLNHHRDLSSWNLERQTFSQERRIGGVLLMLATVIPTLWKKSERMKQTFRKRPYLYGKDVPSSPQIPLNWLLYKPIRILQINLHSPVFCLSLLEFAFCYLQPKGYQKVINIKGHKQE